MTLKGKVVIEKYFILEKVRLESKQYGDAGSSEMGASAANPVSKVGISSTNVGGRSRDTNRRGGKKLRSRKSVLQCSRFANVYKKLPDLRMSSGEGRVPEACKSRLKRPQSDKLRQVSCEYKRSDEIKRGFKSHCECYGGRKASSTTV